MRHVFRLLPLVLLAALLAACGSANVEPQASDPSASNQPPAPSQNNQPVQEIQGGSVQVQVYYADDQLTQLVTEERGINYNDDQEKYEQAIALLGEPAEAGHQPLWKDFAYHSITFADGTLTIDADGKNQYNFGSTGEAFAIEALKQTLFQFPEVEQIKILVDGKPAESLMGHVDISQPLTR